MDVWHVIGIAAAVSIVLSPLSSRFSRGASHCDQLDRLERKLDLILKHLGLEDQNAAGLPQMVEQLARSGRKIKAIKLLRDQNPGLGLKEAKAAVEEMLRQPPQT